MDKEIKITDSISYDPISGTFNKKSQSGVDSKLNNECPQIIYFRASQNVLVDETPIKLNWKVDFAESVFIDGKKVPLSGSTSYHSLRSKVVTLKAIAKGGKTISKNIYIETSDHPPVVVYFRAEPSYCMNHQPVKLCWEIQNAVKANIDNGIGAVSAVGSIEVVASQSQVYELTAESLFGQISYAKAEVTAFPTPLIKKIDIPNLEISKDLISWDMPICNIEPVVNANITLTQPSFSLPPTFSKLNDFGTQMFLKQKGLGRVVETNGVYKILKKMHKKVFQLIKALWKKKQKDQLKQVIEQLSRE